MSVTVAKLEGGRKCGGVGTGQCGDPGENLLGCGRRLFFEGSQGVAQEGEGAGRRFRLGGAKLVFLVAVEEEMLT